MARANESGLVRISRAKIEDFMGCARCFWLDRVKKVARPPSFPFTLNNAVDALLKREFDRYREAGKPHPLMVAAKIPAVPFRHPQLETWRTALKGITAEFPEAGLLVTGAVDDVWVAGDGTLFVVDYKATAKAEDPGIDAPWQEGYRRQVAVYQWLLRRNGFRVSNVAYFVYVNGQKEGREFNGRLEFDSRIIPYQADDSWIEGALVRIGKVLKSSSIPAAGNACTYCEYRRGAAAVEGASG